MSEPHTFATSILILIEPGHASTTGYSRISNSLPMPGITAARPVFAIRVLPANTGRVNVAAPVTRYSSVISPECPARHHLLLSCIPQALTPRPPLPHSAVG